MKATEQYFPAVLFIMLYKVVLSLDSVDEILKCDHSNEIYWAVLSCGAVCCAVQGGSMAFESVDEILRCYIKMKATEQFIMLNKVVLRLECVDKMLKNMR